MTADQLAGDVDDNIFELAIFPNPTVRRFGGRNSLVRTISS